MRKLNLQDLNKNILGLSNAYGAFLEEAAVVCLNKMGHRSGAILKLRGSFTEKFSVIWDSKKISKSAFSSWTDMKEATEFGSTGLAILLLKHLFDFSLIARRAGAADYTLHNFKLKNDNTIYPLGYVEISGILRESDKNKVTTRVTVKKKQVERISKGLPYFVIVIEFGIPKGNIKTSIW